MSSDCDSKFNSVSNGDTPDTPPRKKKAIWYKQPFNEEWLQIEELKPEPGDKYASKCTVCDTKLLGVNKSALLKHAQTSKHEKNFKAKHSSINIKTFMAKPSVSSIQCKVAKAEIALTAFVGYAHCLLDLFFISLVLQCANKHNFALLHILYICTIS